MKKYLLALTCAIVPFLLGCNDRHAPYRVVYRQSNVYTEPNYDNVIQTITVYELVLMRDGTAFKNSEVMVKRVDSKTYDTLQIGTTVNP